MKNVWIFDLDDTLYPEQKYVLSGFRAVDDWLQNERGLSGFLNHAERLFQSGVRGNIFNKALDKLGVAYEQKDIFKLVEIYRNHKPQIEMYADAEWLLRTLPKERLGLITDGYLIAQKRKVEALALVDVFSAIIYSDEFGRENWKPSQLPYLKIMEFWERESVDFIYIGDNPAKDFVTARSLGWKTIMVKRGNGVHNIIDVPEAYKADCEVHNFYQFSNLSNFEI